MWEFQDIPCRCITYLMKVSLIKLPIQHSWSGQLASYLCASLFSPLLDCLFCADWDVFLYLPPTFCFCHCLWCYQSKFLGSQSLIRLQGRMRCLQLCLASTITLISKERQHKMRKGGTPGQHELCTCLPPNCKHRPWNCLCSHIWK